MTQDDDTHTINRMARIRSRAELERAFAIQRQALAASATAYDRGDKWEAIRLAAIVFTLVHDRGAGFVSILNQLGIKDSLKFIASGSPISDQNVMRQTPLISMRISGEGHAEYVPAFAGPFTVQLREVSFGAWWDRERIFKDSTHLLSRRRLVFALRNKEGGGHFDPAIEDDAYLRLADEQITTPSVSFGKEQGFTPVMDAESAMMRQIGWELEKTLERVQ